MIVRRLKRFLVLAIVAAFLTGCSITPVNSTEFSGEYPQMYTANMLKGKSAVEEAENVTFLGVYDDTFGGFLVWARDESTGKCHATLVDGDGFIEMSCVEAWELYVVVCKKVGNCS